MMYLLSKDEYENVVLKERHDDAVRNLGERILDLQKETLALKEMRTQIAACAEYLKEGETPAECIWRNRDDAALTGRMLAKERKRVEELETAYVKSDETIQIWVHKYRERGERIKELEEELKTSQKAYVDLWVNAARGEVSE